MAIEPRRPEGAATRGGRTASAWGRRLWRSRLKIRASGLAGAVVFSTLALAAAPVTPARAQQPAGFSPGDADAFRCVAMAAALDPRDLLPACDAALDAAPNDSARLTLLLSRAQLRIYAGDRAGAVADLTAATLLDRRSAPAWFHLGRALEAEDPLGAATAYESALAIGSPGERGIIARKLRAHLQSQAQAAARAGDYPAAIGFLDRLLSSLDAGAARHELFTLRARFKFLAGDMAGAGQDWEAAIAAAPEQPWAYADRGVAMAAAGETTVAIVDLAAAYARREAATEFRMPIDRFAGLLRDQGLALLQANDVFAAAEAYRQAVAIVGPSGLEPATAHYRRVVERQIREGRWEAASQTIATAASFFRAVGGPIYALDFDFALAELYLQIGERGRAKSALTENLAKLDAALASARTDRVPGADLIAARLYARAAGLALALDDDATAAAVTGAAVALTVNGGDAGAEVARRLGDAWFRRAPSESEPEPIVRALAAYETAQRTAASPPLRYTIALKRAEAEAALGRADAAMATLNAALDQDPSRAEAWIWRGDLKRALEDFSGAEADFSAAIAAAETSANAEALTRALTRRAALRRDLGRPEQALTDLDRWIRVAPSDATAYMARGQLRGVLGEADAALRDYAAALELAPQNVLILRERAALLMRMDRYEEARADLDRVLALRPNWAPVRLERAQTAFQLRDYRAAAEDYDRVIAALSSEVFVGPEADRALRAVFYRGLSRFNIDAVDAAHEDFAFVLEMRPADPLARLWRGRTHLRLGRVEAAMADFDAAFEDLPEGIVRLYQERLNARGFDLGEPDGRYGPATRRALLACAEAQCI